jgi:hypothetical protein
MKPKMDGDEEMGFRDLRTGDVRSWNSLRTDRTDMSHFLTVS